MSGFKSHRSPNSVFSEDDLRILKTLKDDPNIVIIEPDKGNGLVILDKLDYNQKMMDILNNSDKFKKLDGDPVKITIKRENCIKNFLRQLKKENIIDATLYSSLRPTGFRPGILYGLPKVHKLDIPLRPILSSINSHSYNIAKYLVSLLRPFSINQYSINDSFSFLQELHSLDLNTDNVFMASFDITSLFTNIPLTIDIIIQRLFNTSTHFQGFSIPDFRKLLNLAVKNCHFLFDGSVYDQIDGVAMGWPLDPLFANIFLCSHESTWLNSSPSDFKPLYYRRYVDCFVLFRSSDHVLAFLNYLNSQHRNINFTFEYENNDSIHFLDILIDRSAATFLASVYGKPTFTGVLTNFIRFTYRKGLICSLLNRCFRICSTYPTFSYELEKLKSIFISNAFPARRIYSCFNLFLHKVSSPLPKPFTVPKRLIYFSLPFTGLHFLQIQTQLRKLFSSAFPQITIRFVPRPTVRLSNFTSEIACYL